MDRNKTHRPVCKKTSGKTVCAPSQREAQKEEREMKKGKVHIIFGTGMGKTAMALGRGVSAAMHGRKVIMIQFLKGVLSHETADGLKQLEPAFKVFRFEKQNEYYENLSEEGKKEELCNIQNGYNFAKKVLCTGECDMLILDEFGEQLNISFPLQDVKGASGDISFEITAADMPKMMNARNIDFKLHLKGRETAETLKDGETISMKLKLKKTGGISI